MFAYGYTKDPQDLTDVFPATNIVRLSSSTIVFELQPTTLNKKSVEGKKSATLNGVRVRFDKERDLSMVQQCTRCQEFGHKFTVYYTCPGTNPTGNVQTVVHVAILAKP